MNAEAPPPVSPLPTAAPPAPPEPEPAAEPEFDPAEHTVAEVKAYLDANPGAARKVLRAERRGRNRKSLLND